MKTKLIAFVLALVSLITPAKAFTQGEFITYYWNWDTSEEEPYWNQTRRDLPPLGNGISGFPMMSGADLVTYLYQFGSGLTVNNTTKVITGFSGAYADLTGRPSTFAPSTHNHSWAEITSGKPSTLAGYGITDGFTTANARAAVSLTTTGTGAATYNSSTGVINVPTPAAAKRQEAYSGVSATTTGLYTVTFPVAFSAAPNIQANIINPSDTQSLRITAVSTTGFTVLARNRTDVVGLLPAFSNASGLAIDVLVTEK